MRGRVWVLALIDDPFDAPGEGLLGGGQAFMFELGRCLVREGFDLTYVTQRNSADKPVFESLGPRCRIHRLAVGPPRYRRGEEAGLELEALTVAAQALLASSDPPDSIHCQYWVSAAIGLRLKERLLAPIIYYPMSFGRAKRASIAPSDRLAEIRESVEPAVLSGCDTIVVGTPEEKRQLKSHYPGVTDEQILLAPLWCDDSVFERRPRPTAHYVRRAVERFSEGL